MTTQREAESTKHDATDTLADDLKFIREQWPRLCEARIPGTARPWRQALLDPDRRAAMADRDREERQNRNPDAPGFTSAPQHLDVLDVMLEIWIVLDDLAWRISQIPNWLGWSWAVDDLPNDVPQRELRKVTDVEPMLTFIDQWIDEAKTYRPEIFVTAAVQLRHLCREVMRLLGLVRAGQLLAGAICPWCRGVTPKQPSGGATTMRVEEVTPRKKATAERRELKAEYAVVCWNPMCDPPEGDCGTWYRGRPAWHMGEWDWLAKRLIVADQTVHRTLLEVDPFAWAHVGDDNYPIEAVGHSHRSGVDASLGVVGREPSVLDGVLAADFCTTCGVRIKRGARYCATHDPSAGSARRLARPASTGSLADSRR